MYINIKQASSWNCNLSDATESYFISILTILGDVIHLYGFYPESTISTNNRPRPTYNTPGYSPHTTAPYPTTRPSWDHHETNHISSPSYYPLKPLRPETHFGLIDENGYGSSADSIYSDNKYGGLYGQQQQQIDDYQPAEGI